MSKRLVTVAIDDICGDQIKKFKADEAQNPETIRRRFGQDFPPKILHDVTNDEETIVVLGRDRLEGGHDYVWKLNHEVWENKEIIQNALFCSMAVYASNPFLFLKNKEQLRKSVHTVKEVIACGKYGEQLCLISLTVNQNREKMLLVALRGSSNHDDWKDNFGFDMVADQRFLGKIHGGFLKRTRSIDIRDIKNLSVIYDVVKIITCGHSLGGAVSSLLHMALLQDHDEDNDPVRCRNIVNITFGAPLIGNKYFENEARAKEYSKNMYHFAFLEDIVPTILSIGHTFKTLKEQLQMRASDASLGISEVARQLANKWIKQNLNTLMIIEKFALQAVKSFLPSSTESAALEDFLTSYSHLKISLESSTLHNDFEEHSYVPAGKYLILRRTKDNEKGVELEMMPQNSKIVERVLQSASERAAQAFDFKAGHQIETYEELIKKLHGGFKKFHSVNIQLHKVPIDDLFSKMNFDLLCTFVCGYVNCNEAYHTTHLYENEVPLIFCRTCQNDTTKEEYFYHNECSGRYHEDKEHVEIKIRYDIYQNNSKEEVHQLFLQSYDENILVKYVDQESVISRAMSGYAIFLKEYVQTCLRVEKILDMRQITTYGAGELAEEASKLSLNMTNVGMNFGVSFAIFGVSTIGNIIAWWTDKISAKEFMRVTLTNFGGAIGSALGSWGGEFIGGAIGSFFGPIGLILGAGLGGLIGGIVGHDFGQRVMDYISENFIGLKMDLNKDEQKAMAFVESMIFLGVATDIRELTEQDVKKNFRKKALRYHPDKIPADASEEQKMTAMAHWHSLDMAQQMLLCYCQNPDKVSWRTTNLISEKWKAMNCEVDIARLSNTIQKLKDRAERRERLQLS